VAAVLLDARMTIRGLGISTFVDRLMEGFAVHGGTGLTLWKGAGGWDRAGRLSTVTKSGLFDISPRLDPRTRAFDVVHYLSNTGSLFPGSTAVVTVHDLLYRRSKRRRDRFTGLLLERTLMRAARIVAVSDRTRKEIGGAFPQLAGRVEVIPHGMRRIPRCGIERTHLLAFGGGRDPRKRIDLMLDVYAAYRSSTPDPLPLIVLARAGLAGDQPRRLAAMDAQIVPGAGSAEVDKLLAGAAAVIYTTATEGFGLPILEAAEFGTPIVMESSADVAGEVIGEHCFQVEGTNPPAWAAAVSRAVAAGTVDNALDLPDWETVAACYLELYNSVAPS
jgi:glycosyltransferase involved in cell wall biosynthesis